jgi:hypothetical protein
MYYNTDLQKGQPKTLSSIGLSVLALVCYDCKHVGRHSPQTADRLDCNVLDRDLCDHTRVVLPSFGAGEINVRAQCDRALVLLGHTCSGKLHSVDDRRQLIVSEVACEDLCINSLNRHSAPLCVSVNYMVKPKPCQV